MDFQKSSLRALIVLVVLVGWCVWLWQPARQVRLHQKNLLKAYEHRDWARVGEFLDAKYADRWGHDKEFVLRASKEVFSQFLTVGITSEVVSSTASGPSGQIAFRVKMQGQGGPLVPLVIDRVNALHEPFTCEWTRQSWKPWDWKLVRVEQPELDLNVPEL
jgi:hypothetical protein